MNKTILTILLALSLSSCGMIGRASDWLWEKSENLGKHMPVSSSAQRCEGTATCFGKRAPQEQPAAGQQPMPQQPMQQQMQQPYPQQQPMQNQQGGGYIPTTLPGQKDGDPNLYDEMSKKLPPDLQGGNQQSEAYQAYQQGLQQQGIQQQIGQQPMGQPVIGYPQAPAMQGYQSQYPAAPSNIRMGY